ncbi:MAG: hypothetical protein ABII93_08485 [Chrysiogenia bacterium]
MKKHFSIRSRRQGVVSNYISTVLLAAVICMGEYGKWNTILIVFFCILLAASIFSYWRTYIVTGIFSLVRSKTEQLDEREIALTREAYRQAYIPIGIACLTLVFVMVLGIRFSWISLTHRGHYSFGLVVLLFLNYLINVMPVSIVAWKEPLIELEP